MYRLNSFVEKPGELGRRERFGNMKSSGERTSPCVCVFTGRNEIVAKVIFLHLFVILFTGGGCSSVHVRIASPPKQTPQEADTPPRSRHPPRSRQPPKKQTPPQEADPPRSRSPKKQTPQEADTPPKYKARHTHKHLYMVLPKYSKIQVLPGITSYRLMKDNKQAIELNALLKK